MAYLEKTLEDARKKKVMSMPLQKHPLLMSSGCAV